MWLKNKVHLYAAITATCIIALALFVSINHFSNDKQHFAQLIEENLHDLETEAVHVLRGNDWISQIRSVQSLGKILSNELLSQIEQLSRQPFSIYLYHQDSLIFWSKPGMIIDPKHKEFSTIPCVRSDHRQDYYIKQTSISDKQDLLKVYFKIPIIPAQEQAYSVGVTEYKFGHPAPDDATLIKSIDGSPVAYEIGRASC